MANILSFGVNLVVALQGLGSWLNLPMQLFSFLGNEYFFLILLPALYWSVDTGLGLRVGIVLLLNTSVNDALKLAFHGPRPYWVSKQVVQYSSETSFGVPSGHAQISTGVWGMLAAGVRRWWAWLVSGIVVLLISLSRLYLGVHFPHDVLLGWIAGGLVLWLVLRFWAPLAGWLKRSSLGLQILVAFLASLAAILIELIPYLWLKLSGWQAPADWNGFGGQAVTLSGAFTAAGTLFGLGAGLAGMHRLGGFSAGGPVWKRCLCYLVGLIGVAALYFGLSRLFGWIAPDAEAPLPYALRFIRYTLVGAWVSFGAPWTFLRLKLAGMTT